MGLLKYLTWLSFVALIIFAIFGTANYVTLLIILAHVVLLFRDILWEPIPEYLNSDALDDRFVPEYKKQEDDE